jgi:hypothetical protein
VSPEPKETEPGKKEDRPKEKAKRAPKGPLVPGGSREARRLAAAILEVLGGARLPSEAAAALGTNVPRYYLLESRALKGLVEACEPRPLGRVRSAESELAQARKEVERLHRENARYAALVRAAQRTVGLAPPPPPKPAANGKTKKKRKPTVRALRAVERLQEEPAAEEGVPSSEAVASGGS